MAAFFDTGAAYAAKADRANANSTVLLLLIMATILDITMVYDTIFQAQTQTDNGADINCRAERS
jgi:hypothetical protein